MENYNSEIKNKKPIYTCVVASNSAGLGNRLKCLATSINAANELCLPLKIYWPKTATCFCNFDDLFENDFNILNKAQFNKYLQMKGVLNINTWRLIGCNPCAYKSFLSSNYTDVYNPYEKGYIDFQYNNISKEITNSFSKIFQQIIIKKEIISSAENFIKMLPHNYISFSIRTWYDSKLRSLLFDKEYLYTQLGCIKDNKVFINSDSNELLDEITKRFIDKVVFYPKRTFSGDHYSVIGMQDTLIDLLILSRSNTIHLSYLSSFPEVAWWIGECKPNVILVEDKKRIDFFQKTYTQYNNNMTFQQPMYDTVFYSNQKESNEGKITSEIVLSELRSIVDFNSVIDFGCGVGVWIKTCHEMGIKDILGVDFYPEDEDMIIDKEYFSRKDITTNINFYKRFDIALCLEVAEHLPEDKADQLIKNLICHSDIILFGAAIPYQGGTNHINEQWQSYWRYRFESYSYYPIDIIRPKIWDNEFVNSIYKQNLMLYVKDNIKQKLKEEYSRINLFSVVHPDVYKWKVEEYISQLEKIYYGDMGIKFSIKIFRRALKKFILKKIMMNG